MSLQQSNRRLLSLCVRMQNPCENFPSATGTAAATQLVFSLQHTPNATCTAMTAPACATTHSAASKRWYAADAPDPMIVPLQKQSAAVQQQHPAGPPDRNRGPWERVQHPASGGVYWWNKATGVTTPVGAAKPDAWVEVVDKQTGLTYYWNKESGDTTAVGEPLPGPEGRLAVGSQAAPQQQLERPSAMAVLGNSLAVGFGIGLVFGVIRLFM